MQLLLDTTLLYSLIATIAAGGIVISRGQEEAFAFPNGRHAYSWIIPAFSIVASSVFQFWILVLPLIPLGHSEILILSILLVALLSPVYLSRNPALAPQRFRALLSAKLRITNSVVVLLFYGVIQPLAFLYLAEHTFTHFFMNSSYFSIVFLLAVAGVCALLGGKNVAAYISLPFMAAIVAGAVGTAFFGITISDLQSFLKFPMEEATQFFVAWNFTESNWIYGCVAFCALGLWIWWIDKGIVLPVDTSSEKWASPQITLTSSFVVGSSIMFLSIRTAGIVPVGISGMGTSLFLRHYNVLGFFLLLGLVSAFISTFVRSFQIIGRIVHTQLQEFETNGQRSEKTILIARLAILSEVLLTILFIPFAQQAGVELLILYVTYLVCFATPFAATFFIFLIWRGRAEAGIGLGVGSGLIGGIIAMALLVVDQKFYAGTRFTPYEIGTGIIFLSIICAIGGIVFHSKRIRVRDSSKVL